VRLTVPPAGVTALGPLAATVAVRAPFRLQVSQAAAMPRVVLIGFDNNVGSSSSVTIGSIHRRSGGPHRSLVRMHPASYHFVIRHGWDCIEDIMEATMYADDAR